jgi:hypothetical protein
VEARVLALGRTLFVPPDLSNLPVEEIHAVVLVLLRVCVGIQAPTWRHTPAQ